MRQSWVRLFTTVAALAASGLVSLGREEAAILLREQIQPEQWQGYVVDTQVVGELSGEAEGQRTVVRVQGRGMHEFVERALTIEADLPGRTLRQYRRAEVEVQIGGEKQHKSLRPERRCIVFGRLPDGSRGFSPQGPLTRDELELTTEHLAPSVLAGLLPAKVVRIGETWKVSTQSLAEACLLDAVIEHQVEGRVSSIENDVVHFSIGGKVQGVDKGAKTSLHLEVRGRFDRKNRQTIEWIWEQQEERSAGWWNPASRLQVRAQLRRREGITPATSTCRTPTDNLAAWLQPAPQLLELEVEGPQKCYHLRYGRQWYIVGQTDSHLLMRLAERGVVVAQLTLTNWRPKTAEANELIAEFRKAVTATPGWQADATLAEGIVRGIGTHAYRIVQTGTLGRQKVIQRFWLVAGPNGEQLVVTTTVAPEQAERFGNQDEDLLRRLTFTRP